MHVIVLTDAEVRCSQKLTDAWEGIEKKKKERGGGGGGGINGRVYRWTGEGDLT